MNEEKNHLDYLPDRELRLTEGLLLVEDLGDAPLLLPAGELPEVDPTFNRSISLASPGTPAW